MKTVEWHKLKEVFNEAIDLLEDERATFLEKHDESICREVEKLIKAHEEAEDFINESAFVDVGLIDENEADFYIGKQIDDYKIQAEIGHGGMGTVYLAAKTDETFDKKVAIKLIKRGMDTSAVLKRFVMERKILAQLENPNIASLIDGGSTKDGLPYLVMEYIEGEPITKFCDSHQYSIEERLELFRKVCSAISYAHQNLVVHRDIKPSNILVTKDGTLKLLDFGIAKLLHPDWSLDTNEATATMFRLMTPEYASPEQIRGLPITTASDVYSLGVVLYELLSGERPYKIESRLPQEVAQIILTEEPIKPSAISNFKFQISNSKSKSETNPNNEQLTKDNEQKINPKFQIPNLKLLRGDLDNIILKALRKEPERRYQSVQEFSEDIRRHLVGLPVTATADTRFYRIGKFVKRHRFDVALAAIIFLSLLAGITATAWQTRRANLEREKAERRFNESRKLTTFLMSDVLDALGVNAGNAKVQKDLAQNTLTYLDNLAKEESEDGVLLGELASAYVKLGKIQDSTLNETDASIQSFQKAVELNRQRVALAPNDTAIKRDLVGALGSLSELLIGVEGKTKWFEVCGEILNLQKEILETEPHNVKDLVSLAGSYQSRGEMFDNLKRRDEAVSDYRNALSLIEKAINLSKDSAQTPQEKADLSHKYIWQGEIYAGLEDWQNSANSNRTAGEIAETVWRENPNLMQALRHTVSSHRRLGSALEKLGDLTGMLENFQYSLRLISEERVRNPGARELKHGEAMYDIRVGTALHKVGEAKQAFEMVKRGLALDREAIAENTDRASSIQYSFETFGHAAEFFAATNQNAEAVAVYKEWAQYYEKLLEQKPQEKNLMIEISNIYASIGDVHARFNKETKTVSATNRTELNSAKNYYQKSLNQLRQIQNPNADVQDSIKTIEAKSAQCSLILPAS
jgi:eukaryotic-like serine/threonine-protein kinase